MSQKITLHATSFIKKVSYFIPILFYHIIITIPMHSIMTNVCTQTSKSNIGFLE